MRRLSTMLRAGPLAFVLAPLPALAAPWEPRPDVKLPGLGDVTQKLELVDLNSDGFVDIVHANSRGDAVGGDADAQLSRVSINDQGQGFVELGGVFDEPDNAYAIKAGDLDGDGDPDLVVGVNFGGQSYALINDGGAFTRQDILPGQTFSLGDLELGDLDGDGNLDVLAADWGMSQPFGDPSDPGGPLRLWLGAGDGTFTDGQANLPIGMGALASWSFDLELLDFDNDFDLDVLVASRGPGPGFALRNDGAGVFDLYPVPALVVDEKAKDVNTAFTPIDLDGDGYLDVVSLQDGGEGCVELDGEQVCGNRNSVLINDKQGQFLDNPGGFWSGPANPPGFDVDAAALDVDNNNTPDIITMGLPLAASDPSSQLVLGSGIGLDLTLAPPFPPLPELARGFGLMFADFDQDRREDVAIAVRDDALPNLVLFGRSDPLDGVPEDITPPTIGAFETLPNLVTVGQAVRVRARVHDRKTPTRGHDFRYDPDLGLYNLAPGTVITHGRRLPWIEYALGLVDPADIDALPDTGPEKTILPGVWIGESLWRFDFTPPLPADRRSTALAWRICAIDAADNKTCVGPFQSTVNVPQGSCGDGILDPWETCDSAIDPQCVACEHLCGDGSCDRPVEDPDNCPDDCLGGGLSCPDGICDSPLETPLNCPKDCPCDGDGVCEPPENSSNCPGDCAPFCGDCVCEPPEDLQSCPKDCGFVDPACTSVCGDGTCAESEIGECLADCPPPTCGDDICGPGEVDECPQDCPQPTTGDVDSATTGPMAVDDAVCGCRDSPPATGLFTLALLALLPRRRPSRAR